MKIIKRNLVLDVINQEQYLDEQLNKIERAARICYNSLCSQTKAARSAFIKGVIKSGHESVLEHATISFIVDTDRGTSHQLVRHRLASYSQASTRYIDYTKEKHGNEISIILDSLTNNEKVIRQAQTAENTYKELIAAGTKPEDARAILPTCLATKIYVTMNFRELRHFLKLRLDTHAQTGIRIMAVQLVRALNTFDMQCYPILFDLEALYNEAVMSLMEEIY